MIRPLRALLLSSPLVAIAACAGPKAYRLQNADYGETIRLETGQLLEIQVYARPVSGHEWQREGEGEGVVVEVSRDFDSLRPEASDAGGILTLRLRAERPGREVLRYSYRAPATMDAPPADRVDVVVEVE